MEDIDPIRVNAIIAELTGQRNSALDRCANLAADVAVLKARIASLEPKSEKT
jgi:hypothetical protein